MISSSTNWFSSSSIASRSTFIQVIHPDFRFVYFTFFSQSQFIKSSLLSWMSLCFPLPSSASYILVNLQLLHSLQIYFSWSSSPSFFPVFFLQSLASVRRPDTCQSSAPKSSESFSPEIFSNLQPWVLHQSSASRSSLVFSFLIVFPLQLLDFHYPSEYSLSY